MNASHGFFARTFQVTALYAAVIFFTAGRAHAAPDAQISAKAHSGLVYVNFAIDPAAVDHLGERVAGQGPTMVAWVVELRRHTRNWPNQTVKRATIQATVSRASETDFVFVRRCNGEQVAATERVDFATAGRLLTAFHLPVFDGRGVDPGPYEVVVRAVVSGGGLGQFTTKVLARADVEP